MKALHAALTGSLPTGKLLPFITFGSMVGDSNSMKVKRRAKGFLLLIASAGLLQACSLFKEDKCMECPKWEAPKVEKDR